MSDARTCPICELAMPADASYCTGCGSQLSSAGRPTVRLPRPAQPTVEVPKVAAGLLLLGKLLKSRPQRQPLRQADEEPAWAQPPATSVGPTESDAGHIFVVGDYQLRVVRAQRATVISRYGPPKQMIWVEVSYNNATDATLKHRLSQWVLYDTHGYHYESELGGYRFGPYHRQALKEAPLLPHTHARGWLAFDVPRNTIADYLLFRIDYSDTRHARIALRDAVVDVGEYQSRD